MLSSKERGFLPGNYNAELKAQWKYTETLSVVPLEAIAEITAGIKARGKVEQEVLVVRARDINDYEVDLSNPIIMSTGEKNWLEQDDILISKLVEYHRAGRVVDEPKKITFVSDLLLIRRNSKNIEVSKHYGPVRWLLLILAWGLEPRNTL